MADQAYTPQRPDWLNDDFIKKCIQNDIEASSTDGIHIRNVELQYALPKGENYTSIIIRVIVNVDFGNLSQNGHSAQNGSENEKSEGKERRYILKVLSSQGEMKELIENNAVLEREIDMFKNVLPKLQEILLGVGLQTKFSCRMLHFDIDHDVIVMEDLGAQKYILANRVSGTDFKHTKVLFHKLARLHGSSMKYYEQNTLKDVPFYYLQAFIRHRKDNEPISEAMEAMLGPALMAKKAKELAEVLTSRAGYEKEAELIAEIAEHTFDILCDMFMRDPENPLNAMLHGDCWINNMLYKRNNEGQAIDVLLLDLQGTCINSVAIDFMYYFLTSTSDDVRQYHYHDLVNYYYSSLIETLDKVGYRGSKPTQEQLQEGLIKSSSIFLMHLIMFLPMLKSDFGSEANDRSKSESVSIEELHKFIVKNNSNPIFLETLFITIDLLKEIGVFKYHAELLHRIKSK